MLGVGHGADNPHPVKMSLSLNLKEIKRRTYSTQGCSTNKRGGGGEVEPDDKGIIIIQNIRNSTPSDTALHPRVRESSVFY
jgi:hypothetical protein